MKKKNEKKKIPLTKIQIFNLIKENFEYTNKKCA